MLLEEPCLPSKWFFYNSKYNIDDQFSAFGAESFTRGVPVPSEDAVVEDPPCCSQSTMRRTIYPVVEWLPFSPADNGRLCQTTENDSPVPVGHDRLLFEVANLDKLRPIYWPLPQYAPVIHTHWVFSDSLTPIEPSWDSLLWPIYERFIRNFNRVKLVYERATENAAEIQECVHLVDLRQESKYLRIAVLFSASNGEVYLFKAGSSYIQTRTTANCLLKGKTPRDVLAVLKPFDFEEYKVKYNVPDRCGDDANHIPTPINNLILVFHGVGQKLSDSYSKVNFVYAIDKLRVRITELMNSDEVHRHFPDGESKESRFLILPVNWRFAFKNTERPFDTESILVRSLTHIRHSFVDALMDIPLYMSENRRPGMLAAAANEANRLYDLVSSHHEDFDVGGRVHLVGHSLGSLITADLLSQQPTSLDNPQDLENAPFKFQTHNFFNTGSMLGMFMMLKEKRLRSRADFDKHHENCANDETCQVERPFGCFACKNVYNLIHPCDLLSFLMNATVDGATDPEAKRIVGPNGEPLEPCELPTVSPTSFKVGVTSPPSSPPATPTMPSTSSFSRFMSLMSPSTPKKQEDTESNEVIQEIKEELIEDFKDLNKERRYSRVQEPEEFENDPPKIRELRKRFLSLNENGQIDWKMPDHTRYTASHYLKILTAHFDYWSNREAAKFVAVECCRRPGKHNTIPEYRCQWSTAPEDQTE